MKRLIAYGFICGMVVLVVWQLLKGGEESRVKSMIEQARATVSWTGKESQLSALADANRLGAFLARDVRVNVDVLGGLNGSLSGIEEVRGTYLGARQHLPHLEVRIVDLTISFPDSKHARVELTANFATDKPKDINPQEFLLLLHKNEGSWYIDSAETVRTLQP